MYIYLNFCNLKTLIKSKSRKQHLVQVELRGFWLCVGALKPSNVLCAKLQKKEFFNEVFETRKKKTN